MSFPHPQRRGTLMTAADCSKPFRVDVAFNNVADGRASGANTMMGSEELR